MILTNEQIAYIETNLKFYGIASEELRNDLLDHICAYIEENEFPDFETAYKEALQKFGGYVAMESLQREINLQVTVKKIIRHKKMLYSFSFISALLFFSGLFLKMFYWRGANVLLGSGLLVMITVVLPVYFYRRYRRTENKLYNHP